MKVIFLVFLVFPYYVFAQNEIIVNGKVIDKTTGNPLQGASVFAQNTTIGQASKTDGSFNLKLPPGGYDLIVTFSGYETSISRINGSVKEQSLTVELKPREKELQEVSISISSEVKDGWQKYGSFFTENFIGKTQFAPQTEIKNPEVLKFFYSKKRNRLKVIADQPLIIANKSLGYIIKYAIDSFAYEYATNTNTFVGYPLFEEMQGSENEKILWQQNRQKIYKGSILHFMRSLYNKSLSDQGFEVQYVISANGKDKPFPLKDQYAALNYSKEDSTNIVEFTPNQPVSAVIYEKAKPEFAYLNIDPNASKDFRVSTLTINPGITIGIEPNGYYFEQADIIINGYWAFEKVANMLPYDYNSIE